MCNGILAWIFPKTQGAVAEIMAREMVKVTWWAATFEDTRSGPQAFTGRLSMRLQKKSWTFRWMYDWSVWTCKCWKMSFAFLMHSFTEWISGSHHHHQSWKMNLVCYRLGSSHTKMTKMSYHHSVLNKKGKHIFYIKQLKQYSPLKHMQLTTLKKAYSKFTWTRETTGYLFCDFQGWHFALIFLI